MNNEESIFIYKEWVKFEDYQFKVLVLASVLAENKLGFRGTLGDICEWLGIQNASKNTKAIKEAIAELHKKGYIFYNKEGRTHHISITNKGLKDKHIVNIKKHYIKTLKEYNIAKNGKVNRSWDTMLKVLVVILNELEEAKREIGENEGITIPMWYIADAIGRCEATAGKYLQELTKVKFEDGLRIRKKVERHYNAKGEVRCNGTHIEQYKVEFEAE